MIGLFPDPFVIIDRQFQIVAANRKYADHSHTHHTLSPEVIEKLLSYDYPGKIRQLINIIERAVILASGKLLTPQHILFEHTHALSPSQPGMTDCARNPSQRVSPADVLEALAQCNGHRSKAAQLLGVSERTIYRHLKQKD